MPEEKSLFQDVDLLCAMIDRTVTLEELSRM